MFPNVRHRPILHPNPSAPRHWLAAAAAAAVRGAAVMAALAAVVVVPVGAAHAQPASTVPPAVAPAAPSTAAPAATPAAQSPAAQSFMQAIDSVSRSGYRDIDEIERKGERLFEVKARDDQGRRVELLVDARTGEILDRKVKERRR